jgi:hypothetical protein
LSDLLIAEKDFHASILEVECVPDGADPTGAVSSGCLRLSCFVAPYILQYQQIVAGGDIFEYPRDRPLVSSNMLTDVIVADFDLVKASVMKVMENWMSFTFSWQATYYGAGFMSLGRSKMSPRYTNALVLQLVIMMGKMNSGIRDIFMKP